MNTHIIILISAAVGSLMTLSGLYLLKYITEGKMTDKLFDDVDSDKERCPICSHTMVYGIVSSTCSGGTHREINGWYCENCEYEERED